MFSRRRKWVRPTSPDRVRRAEGREVAEVLPVIFAEPVLLALFGAVTVSVPWVMTSDALFASGYPGEGGIAVLRSAAGCSRDSGSCGSV